MRYIGQGCAGDRMLAAKIRPNGPAHEAKRLVDKPIDAAPFSKHQEIKDAGPTRIACARGQTVVGDGVMMVDAFHLSSKPSL
jgi:hypothetical protein|mmetsp:Transcript_6014/g.13244  ORF Transcript_6014/g.13244 Transcript_6014/m.13244 type:complete len:82 (+) Transcript_6014:104-349(+)